MKKAILILLILATAAAAVFGGFLLTQQPQDDETVTLRLRGDRQIYIGCNTDYTELGAYASVQTGEETRQLNVTQSGDKVDTGKLGSYLLKYTAVSGEHIRTDYRIVHVIDTVKPEIQLLGPDYYTMSVGQPYTEMGCVASDNYDGDLSDRVQTTGALNSLIPGEYQLTYTVTDSGKNSASVTRTVCVKECQLSGEALPVYGKSNGKVIYLTFDDGPGKHTTRLLDILNQFNVKATFFLVDTQYISVAKQIADQGHSVALHATSHTYKKIYASEDAYFQDLYALQSKVKKLTGVESTLIRFPGGSSNRVSRFNPGIMTRLTALVEEKGFTYFDWNVDSKDAGGAKTAQEVFENVTSAIANNKKDFSIVLQHDIKDYSVDAVEAIIRWGLANGYTFLPLGTNSPVWHHRINN